MDHVERAKEDVLYEFLEFAVQPVYQGKIPSDFEGRKNLLKAALPYFPEERQPIFKRIIGIASAQYAYLKAKKVLAETEPSSEQIKADLKKILKTFNISTDKDLEENIEK